LQQSFESGQALVALNARTVAFSTPRAAAALNNVRNVFKPPELNPFDVEVSIAGNLRYKHASRSSRQGTSRGQSESGLLVSHTRSLPQAGFASAQPAHFSSAYDACPPHNTKPNSKPNGELDHHMRFDIAITPGIEWNRNHRKMDAQSRTMRHGNRQDTRKLADRHELARTAAKNGSLHAPG
jgi:hypothetical protein